MRAPRRLAPILLLLIAALAIRIAAATGEIWLDEIWSLRLIDQMKAGNVLPSIAIDNNHYLNTAYLALVGGDGAPLALRALSILLGTLMVAAAGWLQRERGIATVVATMALFAFTFPLVNAGSEARGYAGMLLCALLAIDAMEHLRDRPEEHHGFRLGLIAVTGVLFQPLMLGFIASLGLWTVWETRSEGLRRCYETVRDRFAWTVRLLIPVIAIVGIAVYFGRSGYSLGGVSPFTPEQMIYGIARLFRFLLGLPAAASDIMVLVLVLAILGLAVLLRRRGDNRLPLYLIVMFAMPAAMAIAHLPNTEISRYYLLQAICLLLLMGELFGTLWARGMAVRGIVLVVLLAILAGNALNLQTLIRYGRGDVTAMLNRIVAEGGGPITSNAELRDGPVIDYFLRRMEIDAPFVAYHEVCKTPPRWMLTSDFDPDLPDYTSIGGPDCDLKFRKVESYPYSRLSAFPWTLYKAE